MQAKPLRSTVQAINVCRKTARSTGVISVQLWGYRKATDKAQIPHMWRGYELYRLCVHVLSDWRWDELMQWYTCCLKHAFWVITTPCHAVRSLVPVSPFSSASSEKNDHAQLGTLSAPLFPQEEQSLRDLLRAQNTLIFSRVKGLYMVDSHLFP